MECPYNSTQSIPNCHFDFSRFIDITPSISKYMSFMTVLEKLRKLCYYLVTLRSKIYVSRTLIIVILSMHPRRLRKSAESRGEKEKYLFYVLRRSTIFQVFLICATGGQVNWYEGSIIQLERQNEPTIGMEEYYLSLPSYSLHPKLLVDLFL
jgi:hypothetical protein